MNADGIQNIKDCGQNCSYYHHTINNIDNSIKDSCGLIEELKGFFNKMTIKDPTSKVIIEKIDELQNLFEKCKTDINGINQHPGVDFGK